MRKCENCGKENDKEANFCNNCGINLKINKFNNKKSKNCYECGYTIIGNPKFCKECGTINNEK